jgi:hypothetical protein
MKFRKKPVVIEAVEFTGENHAACIQLCPSAFEPSDKQTLGHPLVIPTREGNHLCSPGDFIIKGVKGEFYPCKPDIFTMTYDPAE